MKNMKMTTQLRRALVTALATMQVLLPVGNNALAALTALPDIPIAATSNVPPNLMLTLSVEWPTGVVAAYNDNASNEAGFECPGRAGPVNDQDGNPAIGVCYFANRTYLGYFDPNRCYTYGAAGYFEPAAAAVGHACTGQWSGNYLNWATMHAIDEFRWAMTGGDRVVDNGPLDTPANLTVIEKARHTGDGGYQQFPLKRIRNTDYTANGITVPATAPNTVSPLNSAELYARVTEPCTPLPGGGCAALNPLMAGVAGSEGRVVEIADNADFNNKQTYFVRVKVCDPAFPESQTTCTNRGGTSKPEGLIQRNAEKMRFGVAAYLNADGQVQPGGVIRSRMKFVGPQNIVPNGTATTNANAEITGSGVLPANPDNIVDAGVTGSGVINYLNKFGKANGYKYYDTLSEMFYEATRYVRNLPATPDYTAGLTNAMKDGFPVITGWDALPQDDQNINNRAIQYSCQKTFFLGIADSNTWCDSRVPATGPNLCGHGTLGVEGDPYNINATALDNAVGALEGLGALGNQTIFNGTYHVAGLGYWANTHDILPDDDAKPWTLGNQTAQSFWVDVRETGSVGGKNQMWLAAKYGGFDSAGADNTLLAQPANQAAWDANNDGVPDNYFTGERPDKLINSLKTIFQNVNDLTLSGAGAAVSASNLTIGGSSFQVRYFTRDWSGDVLGNQLALDANGVPTETNIWSARAKLNTQAAGAGWNTGRRIVTSTGAISTANTGVPFRWTNLSTAQQGYLGSEALLNYLRGERANEGTQFRVRTALLGDIVNSSATYVGAPSEAYLDTSNPGFAAFKAANANRTPVVYVGANDGMLHAFNADTSTANDPSGTELFAYVPSFVLPGPNGTPTVDGLQARAKLNDFVHKFYVDGTPVARSVDFARTCTVPTTGCAPVAANVASDWRTILVGGLRKGGKGYYAIDITAPATMNSEVAVAGKVLWEFTDEDMGLSFGAPIIAKTKKYGWVVMLTSGYNNTTGPTNPGKGFLYILNAQTGQLLEKIGTGVGDAANPSGFAYAAGFVPTFADFTVTEVYGGDLNGNLWRFDLTAASGAYPAPVQFATLTDGAAAQPVTSEPRIEIDVNGTSRWVFVGTGRLLDLSDVGTAATDQTQTFYAFRDGTVTTPLSTAAVTLPLTRASLVAQTNLLNAVTIPADKYGWYFDLPNTNATLSQRVIDSPTANEGVIAWIGQVPSTDPCTPGVTSTIYAVEYATGKTRLTELQGNFIASYTVTGGSVTRVLFVKVGDKVRAIFSDEKAKLRELPGQYGFTSGSPVRLNWREILQ